MSRYKLMFRELGKKKFYNFGPTVTMSAKPRYSKIDSMSKARKVKRELSKTFSNRIWKIRKK